MFNKLFTKDSDSTHTTWKLYTTTPESLEAMYKAFEKAEDSVYLETYILHPDSVGGKFLDLCIEKAKKGVTVKIVIDSVGSFSLGGSMYISKLKEAGVKLKTFNWLLPFSKHSKSLWYFRNHRRVAIVDQKVLFTGGFCISKKMENWRETVVRLEGPVVDQAVKVFDQTWHKMYKKKFINLGREWRTNIGGFSFITHAPLIGERFLYHSFIDAIRQAKSYIYITTPYFLPDHRLYRVLRLAQRRGVDVRILMPRYSNMTLVDHGSHTYFHSFLSKKIKIFRYDEMIHAKTAVIDGEWSMVGTLNMDNVSLRYNFECGVVSTNSPFGEELKEIFIQDLEKAEEVKLKDWENRPLIEKIKDMLVWPIRKLL